MTKQFTIYGLEFRDTDSAAKLFYSSKVSEGIIEGKLEFTSEDWKQAPEDDCFFEDLLVVVDELGLEFYPDPCGHVFYLGLGWDKMNLDETKYDFSKRVEMLVCQVFGTTDLKFDEYSGEAEV